MQTNKPKTYVSEINVTPLVDVMLVLLIIFMVAAPMMKEGMKVDLPEAEARALQTESQDLSITIRSDRTLDLNGSVVELDRLGPILMQIKEERNIRGVFLQADKSVPYGNVVQVMSLLRSTGLNELNLVTQPPGKK